MTASTTNHSEQGCGVKDVSW